MRLLLDLLALIRALAADRARLALENLVLRQQLNVLRRSVKRARLDDSDRIFWVLDSPPLQRVEGPIREAVVTASGDSKPAHSRLPPPKQGPLPEGL